MSDNTDIMPPVVWITRNQKTVDVVLVCGRLERMTESSEEPTGELPASFSWNMLSPIIEDLQLLLLRLRARLFIWDQRLSHYIKST